MERPDDIFESAYLAEKQKLMEYRAAFLADNPANCFDLDFVLRAF